MRRKTLLTVALGLTLTALAAADAARAEGLWRPIDGRGARQAWTPEAMEAARPMPLPAVDVEALRGFGDKGFVAANVGTGNLHFTSSRLVPEDSRLFYPYSAVGRLFFRVPGEGNFVCSGAVVSLRVVLTAGHCVFSAGDFHVDFLFVPAYYRGEAPFGAWEANFVGTTDDWASSELVPNDGDFGVLVMDDQDITVAGTDQKVLRKIGQVTGWLGWIKNKLERNLLHSLGYPVGFDQGERMHQSVSGESFDVPTGTGGETFCYGSDMRGGASGGPMVQNFGVKARGQRGGRNKAFNRIVSVNSFTSSDAGLRVLCGSEVNNPLVSLINAACASGGGNCTRKGKPKAP